MNRSFQRLDSFFMAVWSKRAWNSIDKASALFGEKKIIDGNVRFHE